MFLIDSEQPEYLNSNTESRNSRNSKNSKNSRNNSTNSDLDIRPSKSTIEQINFPEFCKMLSNFNGKVKRLNNDVKNDVEIDNSSNARSKDKKLQFLFKLYDSNN